MASNYYDQTKVKADLNITDTGHDTQLDHWSDEAEAEIDNLLYIKAAKARLLTKLPVLPYASGSVPEAVQGAADNYVKMRYYQFVKNFEASNDMKKTWQEQVENYVSRLGTDSIIYGRIAR